ncbi:MAG: NAD(P)/FAD-dependent oxidoreductase [Deltaproteobacteria bacterium]|nr:NAD(P)/FAD-dependent oxidoreductase [Deltaproteobacteria bacterium]
MDNFHTVIIGAGPAGLQCAAILAEYGRQVVVLERRAAVGPKVCAGGIPSHALRSLRLPPELIEKSFSAQHIYTPWQRAVIKAQEPIISTVNRQRLGRWMLRQAREKGVVVLDNSRVTGIDKSHVQLKNRKIGYQYLVGADGSSSLVRRYLNIPAKRQGVGINYQIPVQMPQMEWHLNPRLFNSGYAWIFPHRLSTSVGAYAPRHDLPPQKLRERFCLWARERGIAIDTTKVKAALVNSDYRGWNFGRIFLAGDAAGLASGFTGEGIYPAIVSGQTIAHTIINQSYKPAHLQQLIKQQKRHNRIQKKFTGNKVVCQITLEMLVLALRMGLIKFDLLEMN